MKKCITLSVLICLFFLSIGIAQHIDQAPLKLDRVSNLLKWSDMIVIAVRDDYADTIRVEEFILNKKKAIRSSLSFKLSPTVQYEHITPIVMDGYRYLFFLSILEDESDKSDNKIVCKITAGRNGLIALFDQNDLKDHPRILRMIRISPNYDRINAWKNTLHKNFGTTDGQLIREAVERVVALYAEEDPKSQAGQLIESLRDGNPAMIRLSRELLQSVELEPID